MEKKLFTFVFSTILIFSLLNISCKSTDVEVLPDEDLPEETVIVEPEIPEEIIIPEELDEPEPIEELEEPENDFDDFDEVEFLDEEPEELDEIDEEYIRSTNNLDEENAVSKEEFSDDKTTILNSIADLSSIMETKNYQEWLKYIDPTSIAYYSNPANLRKAEKKLPYKTIQIRTINDYFLYVFIPSRKRSQVDEIRYISKTDIKAVQVKEDFSTVVYYYFKKVDGKWMVYLPPV